MSEVSNSEYDRIMVVVKENAYGKAPVEREALTIAACAYDLAVGGGQESHPWFAIKIHLDMILVNRHHLSRHSHTVARGRKQCRMTRL
jgi:hypothetical protein